MNNNVMSILYNVYHNDLVVMVQGETVRLLEGMCVIITLEMMQKYAPTTDTPLATET